jgi:hypothetical protein
MKWIGSEDKTTRKIVRMRQSSRTETSAHRPVMHRQRGGTRGARRSREAKSARHCMHSSIRCYQRIASHQIRRFICISSTSIECDDARRYTSPSARLTAHRAYTRARDRSGRPSWPSSEYAAPSLSLSLSLLFHTIASRSRIHSPSTVLVEFRFSRESTSGRSRRSARRDERTARRGAILALLSSTIESQQRSVHRTPRRRGSAHRRRRRSLTEVDDVDAAQPTVDARIRRRRNCGNGSAMLGCNILLTHRLLSLSISFVCRGVRALGR